MSENLRARLFRDPIHGDVRLGPIQATIVDTQTFQRLRYIKQNGLLHFVFPGAVHTRFAHSIGTSFIARRVFDSLANDMRGEGEGSVDSDSVKYLEQVFVTAALLHDCGHSAFSHSIEGVTVNGGESIFRSLEEMADEWSTPEVDLSEWLESVKRDHLKLNESHITHEEIGLLLIARLNCEKELKGAVTKELNEPLSDFLSDVQSLIEPRLPCSETFKKAAKLATKLISGAESISPEDRTEQLHRALSSLISGTLDVDRMDYLLRDSHYTGTAYGVYDFHTLVNSIRLGVWESDDASVLLICLQERACSAFDDFLWGRYQLFNQVLNHKANVMLNAMLDVALEEIIDSKAHINRPRDFKDFLAFTDEYIMSNVIVAGLSEDNNRLYKRVLVDRILPKHLGREEITDLADVESNMINEESESVSQLIQSKKAELAAVLNLSSSNNIRHCVTECKFLKNVTHPFVIRRDKTLGEEVIEAFEENDSYQLMKWQDNEGSSIPAIVSHVHFFIDKNDL